MARRGPLPAALLLRWIVALGLAPAGIIIAADTTTPGLPTIDQLLGPYGLTVATTTLSVLALRALRQQYEARLAEWKERTAEALKIAHDANETLAEAMRATASRNQLEREVFVGPAPTTPAPRRVRRPMRDELRATEERTRREAQ